MVRKRVIDVNAGTRVTYLTKADKILDDMKESGRIRALLVPRSTFQRFVDYTTIEDRIAEQREKEAAKLTALKKKTHDKTKTWDSTIANIKARRREELLSKRRKAEEERETFVKEIAEKKVAERAEVVKQARSLLLQKKPLCRRINSALLASECFRELDAQVAFQKTIRAMDKERDTEYINSIKADIAKHEEQKRREAEERAQKTRNYRIDLRKQIEKNKYDNKLKTEEELKIEKEERKNATRDLQLMKEKEMQEASSKKKQLRKLFKDAIEEKRRFELKSKRDEELEDRALEIYREAKDRIRKMHKSAMIEEREKRAHRAQIIAEHLVLQIRGTKKLEILDENVKDNEAIEAENRKAQKEREDARHAFAKNYRQQLDRQECARAKQKQEEKDLDVWEMMQRFKKDEFDKRTNLEECEQERQRKLEYRNELRKDFEEKEIERKREREILKAEDAKMKAAIEEANQKILLYGEEVVKESKGVRPLYPILKAIEKCKKEMRLTSTKRIYANLSAERL